MVTRRNKGGRPPKPKSQKQSEGVRVYLTPSEARHLAKWAKARGVSKPEALRQAWLRQLRFAELWDADAGEPATENILDLALEALERRRLQAEGVRK